VSLKTGVLIMLAAIQLGRVNTPFVFHVSSLRAAAEAVAEHGVGAPTALIGKLARVAEGPLYRYFATKE
jgi:hypothetical protein